MHWNDTGFVSFIDSDEEDDPRIPRRLGGAGKPKSKQGGASKAARLRGEDVKDVTAVVERVSLEQRASFEHAPRGQSFDRDREQRGPSFDRAFEMPVTRSKHAAEVGAGNAKGKGAGRHGANFIDLR